MTPLRQRLDRLYWRMAARVAPHLINAQYRYLEAVERQLRPGTCWLDLGCGHQIVPAWMKQAAQRERDMIATASCVVGVDVVDEALRQHPNLTHRVVGDLHHLPFSDASFDLITANMVMEHVRDPQALLREVSRVLRPGGAFVFHTPNAIYPMTLLARCVPQALKNAIVHWLDGRPADDVFPALYRMNRPAAIRATANEAALEVDDLCLCESSADTCMLGPIAVAELLFTRLTRSERFAHLRSNLVVTLRRPRRARFSGRVSPPCFIASPLTAPSSPRQEQRKCRVAPPR